MTAPALPLMGKPLLILLFTSIVPPPHHVNVEQALEAITLIDLKVTLRHTSLSLSGTVATNGLKGR